MINLKVLSAAAILAVAVPMIDATPSHAQGRGWHGGGHGGWHGGGGRGWGRGGGFAGGAIAGALIGGAIASQGYGYGRGYGYGGYGYGGGYYGGTPYYGTAYGAVPYDDGDDVVEVAPGGGDVNYCIQTYKSYNPRTGTYLGYDGLRHACP
jgi:hypothetical protein